jgi:hypothetical protein
LVVGMVQLIQQQQKNIMEQVGQHLLDSLNTARAAFLQEQELKLLALGFGGDTPGGGGGTTAATEEWTGAGSPLTKTITVS